MAGSNISRDHIAMEAMKVIMEKTTSDSMTMKNRIKKFLGMNYRTAIAFNQKAIAKLSYEMADAMIAQRENKEEEQQ